MYVSSSNSFPSVRQEPTFGPWKGSPFLQQFIFHLLGVWALQKAQKYCFIYLIRQNLYNKSASYLSLCLSLNSFYAETQRTWVSVGSDTRWAILIKRLWIQVPSRVVAGFESWLYGFKSQTRFGLGLSPGLPVCAHSLSHVPLIVTAWTIACQAPPDKNTRVVCHFLLQGIFPMQGLNPSLLCLLLGTWILYHWATWETHTRHFRGW